MLVQMLANMLARFARALTVKSNIRDHFTITLQNIITYLKTILPDNKAKVRISKRVFQENKARQIFRKTNIRLTY